MDSYCEQDVPSFDLANLPALASWHLSDYLDTTSLKSIRLVCQDWREWAEDPQILQKIPIRIRSAQQIEEMMNSNTTDWNSIVIDWKYSPQELIPLLQYSQPFLKKLQIENFDQNSKIPENYLQTILSNVSPYLHSLDIVLPEGWCNYSHLAPNWDEVKQNLVGLRVLKFDNLPIIRGKDDTAFVELFANFLKYCPNLEMLGFPTLVMKYNDQNEDICLEITNQMMEVLLSKLKRNICAPGRQRIKKIDFNAGKSIEFPNYLNMSSSALKQLVELCSTHRIKLYNVPADALPIEDSSLSQTLIDAMNSCIVSMAKRATNKPDQVKRYLPLPCHPRALFCNKKGGPVITYENRMFSQKRRKTSLNQ